MAQFAIETGRSIEEYSSILPFFTISTMGSFASQYYAAISNYPNANTNEINMELSRIAGLMSESVNSLHTALKPLFEPKFPGMKDAFIDWVYGLLNLNANRLALDSKDPMFSEMAALLTSECKCALNC